MPKHARSIAATIGLLTLSAACAPRAAVDVVAQADATLAPFINTDPNAAIALVQTHDGLAGVPIGSPTPRWVAADAVAAPDGSAVFVAQGGGQAGATTRLWRIDPRTAARSSVGQLVTAGPTAHVFAVEPGGAHLAVAAFDGSRTRIISFDTTTGRETVSLVFDGQLEPEAFSLDSQRIFAARSFGDHYRVTTLDLQQAIQWPTSAYDKTSPPEDMYGNVVQAVLTPGHARLATLYRDPHSSDHTAFVHLLDLNTGITVCIDLTAPFGTGPHESDAIRANADGTIEVGHHDPDGTNGVAAIIDPDAILTATPEHHYHAHAHPSAAPPTIPDLLAATPGFTRFIAVAT